MRPGTHQREPQERTEGRPRLEREQVREGDPSPEGEREEGRRRACQEKESDGERAGGKQQAAASHAWGSTKFICACSVFVHPRGVNLACQAPYRSFVPFFATVPQARREAFVQDVPGLTRCIRPVFVVLSHGRYMYVP